MKQLFISLFSVFIITAASAQQEVMYHVQQRNFFDSNNDGSGDLEGIRQKLGYLNQLGITTIVLSPVYQSEFQNNYYASDLEKIDSKYGSFKLYRDLVQEVHRNKMKLYQEIDLRYVSNKHVWFTDSYKNPKSKYNAYLVYNDEKNEQPHYLPQTANDTVARAVLLNLKNAKVKEYASKVLKYWVDPNGDGIFYDGVDGFRLHYVADETGGLKGLLRDFWTPLVAEAKKVNPELQMMAEEDSSSPSTGNLYLAANADRVMDASLRDAIVAFDKKKISTAADSTFMLVPKNKIPVVFTESPDALRLASLQGVNAGKLRVAAALNILIGGVPSIYYGQELGLKGEGAGMQETFNWVVAEEQQKDANSLWNYYKELIRLKKIQPSLALGDYMTVPNSNDNVIAFTRTNEKEKALVIINLSDKRQMVRLDQGVSLRLDRLSLLSGTADVAFQRGGRAVSMPPYAVQVWRIIPL